MTAEEWACSGWVYLTWECTLAYWPWPVWHHVTSHSLSNQKICSSASSPGTCKSWLGHSFSKQSELPSVIFNYLPLFQLCFLKMLRTSSHQSLQQLPSFGGRSGWPWYQLDWHRSLPSTQHLFLLSTFVYVLPCSPITLSPGMVLTILSYMLNLI